MIDIKRFYYRHFCIEDISLVENYEKAIADDSQQWHCHHRLETHKYKNRKREEWVRRDENIPAKELIALGLYYNRPAKELIFMTESEHHSLHSKNRVVSDSTRQKLSEVAKKQQHPGYNKGKKFSEEWRKHLSEAHKGKKLGPMSEEHKRKLSDAHKGKTVYWAGKRYKYVDGKRVIIGEK